MSSTSTSSGGVVFSAKETELLISCMTSLTGEISKMVDWDKVAQECGYKNAANAKTMFYRLRKNKLGGSVAEKSSKRKAGEEAPKKTSKRVKAAKSSPLEEPADDDETDLETKTPVAVKAETEGDTEDGSGGETREKTTDVEHFSHGEEDNEGEAGDYETDVATAEADAASLSESQLRDQMDLLEALLN